jgi:hypothetical protein
MAKLDWEKAATHRFQLARDKDLGFAAKFNGRCSTCALPLQRGESITRNGSGYGHADCGDAFLKANRGK